MKCGRALRGRVNLRNSSEHPGLIGYVDFRNVSEQAEFEEPE